MEDLKIVTYGSDVLREDAQPIEEITDEIRQLADDMLRVMYASDGIGLAAPQIGVSKRIVVIDLSAYDVANMPLILINPEIVEKEGQAEAEEGCLSVPEVRGGVKRAERVVVEAMNLNGDKIRIEGTNLLARVLQHEIDHLNGKLFIDHFSRLKHQIIKKHLKKLEKESKEEG
jgi:peptide deformylase